jgi:hypothetical protein
MPPTPPYKVAALLSKEQIAEAMELARQYAHAYFNTYSGDDHRSEDFMNDRKRGLQTFLESLSASPALAPTDEALDEFDEALSQWARAYPLTAFPEPDLVKARAALESAGMTLDAVSASNMRHVVTTLDGLFEKVRRARVDTGTPSGDLNRGGA